jgi:sulfite exporter TauE/SafE
MCAQEPSELSPTSVLGVTGAGCAADAIDRNAQVLKLAQLVSSCSQRLVTDACLGVLDGTMDCMLVLNLYAANTLDASTIVPRIMPTGE